MSKRELLIGCALLAVAYIDRAICRLRRTHADTATRTHANSTPQRPCAACREAPRDDGELCVDCDIALTSLAYAWRQADERAS